MNQIDETKDWATKWKAEQAKIDAAMEESRRSASVFSLLDWYRELGDRKALAELKRRGMDWMLQDDGSVEFVTDPQYRDAVVEGAK